MRRRSLQAVQLLKDAVDRDPGFFFAYCELATAHDRIYLAGVDHSNDRLTKAATALEKAQSLRSLRRGDLHLALAEHRYCGYFDFDGAMAELAIAREMLPTIRGCCNYPDSLSAAEESGRVNAGHGTCPRSGSEEFLYSAADGFKLRIPPAIQEGTVRSG